MVFNEEITVALRRAGDLLERERVEIRIAMGRTPLNDLAKKYGTSSGTIRHVHNPGLLEPQEPIRDRQRALERKATLSVPQIDYRAKGCGDGINALCGGPEETRKTGCGRRFTEMDFSVDRFGYPVEHLLCWRCRHK